MPATRGRLRRLNSIERDQAARRFEAGERAAEIAVDCGCGLRTVYRMHDEWRIGRSGLGESGRYLGFAERERISRGLAAERSFHSIGRELGRPASTISREVGGEQGRSSYRALSAHRRSLERLRRPKPSKLSRLPRLRGEVESMLCKRYSPEQISAKLKRDFPDEEEMRISHETIYQSLYIQSRGELRRQLAANLRSGRSRRRSSSRLGRRGRIVDMVPISERPPEVADRAVPGHWEGDLLVGAYGRSFIATLVERHTRYVMLARLGNDGTTEHVIDALKQRIRDLPRQLLLSLTWDQGKELAAHARLTEETGIDVYFCDPHSPWQRGSNENTNGLLRQYLPKGSDLAAHSQLELDKIAAELNGRPRKTLDWDSPAERMQQLLR